MTTGGGTHNSSLIQAGTAVCVTGLLVTTGGGTHNSDFINLGLVVKHQSGAVDVVSLARHVDGGQAVLKQSHQHVYHLH